MPISKIDIAKIYTAVWTESFINGTISTTNILPPPLHIIRSKKETAKILGGESFKKLIAANMLTGGEMRTEIRYESKNYMTVPSFYELDIFVPMINEFVRREFNNELPGPAGYVFMVHLLMHEFSHFVYDTNRYRGLVDLHQRTELTTYRQLSDMFNSIYIEHHELSGKFNDEKRTEQMTMRLMREYFDIDARPKDSDGYTILVPKHDSQYLTNIGIAGGLSGGKNHNEYNIIWSMLRYYELIYLLTFEYRADGTEESERASNEINVLVKYIRQYSFENDDICEFV